MSRPATGFVLALDLGTTNAKGVLVDPTRGEVLLTAVRRCAAEHGARSTQDPAGLIEAAEAVVAELAPRAPTGLVLSSAMHGVAAADAEGRPTTALSTWADPLGADQLAALRADPDRAAAFHERTGTPPHTSSWLCRVPALRATDPAWAAAQRLVSAKELLLRRWFGSPVVDASLASATGLFDARVGSWDAAALEQAGIAASQLGEVVPTGHVLRSWSPEAAARLGLPADTPLVVGATDGVLAHLGVGGEDPDVVSVTLGTSGAARRLGRPDTPVAAARLFRYVLDTERAVVGGAVSNVGRALEWAAALLFPGQDPAAAVPALLEAAEQARPADGLRFDPRLGGERFPDYAADGPAACGGFRGLGYEHGRAELAAAVVDGVLEPVASIVEALDAAAEGPPGKVRIGGGLARSEFVGRRLARRLGRPLEVAQSIESSAIGAARLASLALDLEDGFRFGAEHVHHPD